MTAATGAGPGGHRVHVLHNWNWEPARTTTPRQLTDALSGEILPARTPLRLGPWDVRVFISSEEQ